MSRVRLPYGEPAWLATRYDDVKVVLGDPRFSRAAAVGRDEPRLRSTPSQPGSILEPGPARAQQAAAAGDEGVHRAPHRTSCVPACSEIADGLRRRDARARVARRPRRGLRAAPAGHGDLRAAGRAVRGPRRLPRLVRAPSCPPRGSRPSEVRAAVGSMRAYMAGLIARRRERATDDLLGRAGRGPRRRGPALGGGAALARAGPAGGRARDDGLADPELRLRAADPPRAARPAARGPDARAPAPSRS